MKNHHSNFEIGLCCELASAKALPAEAVDFLEVNVQRFLVPEKGEAEFRPHLEAGCAAHIPIKSANGFLPGDLRCIGPGLDQERLLRYAQMAFERSRQAGVEIVVFGSGAARTMPEGYSPQRAMDKFVGLLCQLGPIAQHHGVTLVVEPLNKSECNFINSLTEGAEAVERCNHPHVRLLADFYHMLKEGEPVSEIVRFGHLIRHAHVAELEGRGFPGKSGEDFRPFLQALEQAGYTGRIALECAWRDGDFATEVESSARYLRSQ